MANSELKTLVEIFNNRIFRIPDYQRGYAWGKIQLNDFWDDLQNLKDGKYHYTGLLTVENATKGSVEKLEKWQDDLWMFDKGFNAYYIVDGQQRLTTSIVLLKVILDKFSDNDSINYDEKSDITKKFLYQHTANFKSYIFGYEKDNPSDEYFKTKILNQQSVLSGVPERTLYTSNLEFAKSFFETKIEKISKPEIEALYKKVVTGLKFNFYEIDNDLDVFVAFEVMNNRGKSLSTLELLKNRLIYLSTLLDDDDDEKAHLRKDINEAWKTVYEYLGKNKDKPLDDDNFLRDHWIMYFGYERGEAEAFTNFLLKDHFVSKNITDKNSDKHISLSEIKKYVTSLSDSIKIWFSIFNPDYPDSFSKVDSTFKEDIREWLRKLNRISFGAFVPIIMASFLKSTDSKKISKLLLLCERFVFLVFRISRRQSNTQNNHFYRVAKDLYYEEMNIENVQDDIENLIDGKNGWYDLSGFNNYIQELFEREQQSGFYGWNTLNYFLYEYELQLQHDSKGQAKTSWENVRSSNSVEHIYPQEVSDECWKKNYPPQLAGRRRIMHSLGNLLLISIPKNSELQNKCFDFKKKHVDKKGNEVGYFNGSYSEIAIAQNSQWQPPEILARGISMLEFMEERWSITIPDKKATLYWDDKICFPDKTG
jgi:hypothetical protein